jgi:hypothetical protein
VRLAAVDETEKNFRVWGKVSSRKCLFKIPLLLELGIVVIVHRTAPATLAVRVVEVLEQPQVTVVRLQLPEERQIRSAWKRSQLIWFLGADEISDNNDNSDNNKQGA